MEARHPNTSRPRILIADDHAIFADALRVYLEKSFVIIGAVTDGRALLAEAIRLRPDVIVTDFAMPLLNGLDATQRIREQVPNDSATSCSCLPRGGPRKRLLRSLA
jgi:CheY-like chemotaxis protein